MLRTLRLVWLPLGSLLCIILAVAAVFPAVSFAEGQRYWWSGSVSLELHHESTYTSHHDGTSQTTTSDWRVAGQLDTPAVHPRNPNGTYPHSIFTASSLTGSASAPTVARADGSGSWCGWRTTAERLADPTFVDVVLERYSSGNDPGNPPAFVPSSFHGAAPQLGWPGTHTSGCSEPTTTAFEGALTSWDMFTCNKPYGDNGVEHGRAILPHPVANPDGSLTLRGTSTLTCDGSTSGDTTVKGTQTYVVDLIGWPHPPGPPPDSHTLTVVVNRPSFGSVVGTGGSISCGQGNSTCSAAFPTGTAVRLGALTSEAGTFDSWSGCDEATGTSCLLTLNSDRTVHVSFRYDFVGQWEPPPEGLFDAGRKAEIAGNGAKSALTGATGCGLSAAGIAAAPQGGVVLAGAGGVATRWQALVTKAMEETVGNCAQGLAGTVYNGFLLKIDPPDPAWRSVALAERFPRAKTPRCSRLGKACRRITLALRKRFDADARVLELQEALAVSANRYGNAVNAGDKQIQAQHQAAMRATSGLLADAYATRNRASVSLARAIRAAGIRRVIIPKAVVARSLREARKPRAVPKAVVARLLRKHLITHPREVTADLRAIAARRPAPINVLAELTRPVATAQMRAAAAELSMADVARLLEGVLRDTAAPADVRAAYAAHLGAALRCDDGSASALAALKAAATGRNGLQGEAKLLLAAAISEVATHDLRQDESCGG